jgi:small subunit ribosomal protein S21
LRTYDKPQNANYTKSFNNKKSFDKPKEENFLDFFKPGVEVRNGDVGKALRILKKKLERNDFQKELAKQQYFEKPSEARKRKKQMAVKRWERHVRDAETAGEMIPYQKTGVSWMKSKKKSRKITEARDRQLKRQRNLGPN